MLEVTRSLTNNRIARVLFFVYGGQMVLLHGFIKKTQQTPKNDLDLAAKRQKEVASGKTAK
jgi:phage-related protein